MKKGHFPKIKKDLQSFLSNEEGRITRKNAKEIALTLIILGTATAGLMKADKSLAQICSYSHNVHCVHSVHSVHSAHSSGAWC